ncbi:MAG TPA: CvpA family protein [Planctomycetes bacterium]|nr:CvpA family protein [Planctomycetota bacterium]HIK61091.1 CvpA family protein [Planctomycetota bacterium]
MIALTETVPSFMSSLPWIDKVGLGVVGLFFLLGIWRGLWWQVVRFLGVVLAVGLARSVSPQLTPRVQDALDLTPAMSHGLSWFLLFLSGLIVAALLGLLGKKALDALQLNLMDRIGGALVGVATGLSLHVALLVLLGGVGSAGFKATHLQGSASWSLLEALAEHHVVAGEAGAASLLSLSGSSD